jgi:hypothetical protein
MMIFPNIASVGLAALQIRYRFGHGDASGRIYLQKRTAIQRYFHYFAGICIPAPRLWLTERERGLIAGASYGTV